MSTALLVIGYVLAVPPLFRLRHAWRERVWWIYAPATIGAVLIAAGWAMKGNTAAAVVNGAWAAGFGIAFPLLAGRKQRA